MRIARLAQTLLLLWLVAAVQPQMLSGQTNSLPTAAQSQSSYMQDPVNILAFILGLGVSGGAWLTPLLEPRERLGKAARIWCLAMMIASVISLVFLVWTVDVPIPSNYGRVSQRFLVGVVVFFQGMGFF